MNFNLNNLPKGLNEGSVQGYATEDEISKMDAKLKAQGKTGYIYDPDAGTNKDDDSVVNLVNVNDVLGNVELILEYMCNDDIIALKEKDDTEYQNHMEEKFPKFSERYYTLFRTVIEGEEDLTHLFSMLGAIERIKKGDISIEKAEEDLGKQLAKQYVHESNDANTNTTNKKKKHKKPN